MGLSKLEWRTLADALVLKDVLNMTEVIVVFVEKDLQ